MPQCCPVPLCSAREAGHRFPTDPIMCKRWIFAIRRDKFTPTRNSRVRKKHFVEDDYELPKDSVKLNPTPRLKKLAVPSKFTWTTSVKPASVRRKVRAQNRALRFNFRSDDQDFLNFQQSDENEFEETEVAANNSPGEADNVLQCAEVECARPVNEVGTECDICECSSKPATCDSQTQTELPAYNHGLKIEDIMDKPNEIRRYTGFVDFESFMLVYNLLGDAVNHLKYYPFMQEATQTRVLSPANEFLLTLIKLRCNSTFDQVASQFGISTCLASNIFITWINCLYCKFKEIDIWPSHDDVKHNLKARGRDCPCTIIIDCTKIKIEKPKNPVAQQQTYSTYKQTNTVKVLVGMSPSGCVTFLSGASGGSVSDRQIFERSGIINLLQDKDVILCDKRFNIQDLGAHKNVQVNMPVFLKGNQFTAAELKQSKQVSTDRIHIERILGLGKNI